MAEATGLRNNALPYAVYGVPWGVVFPILDADGDLVTGATALDSEVSKNGDTFADCTNEATEIDTASGMYYLLLTAAEMTADVVTVIVKTSSSGAKTTILVFYPRKLVLLATGTSQGGAAGYITLAASAVSHDDQYNGCLCVATLDTLVEARILQDCTSSNQQCTVTPSWNVTPDADDTYAIYLPEGQQIPTVNVLYSYGLTIIARGTVGSASTTTSIVTSALTPAGSVGDQFKSRLIIFENGTTTAALRGQISSISASSNAAAPVLTVPALTTAPVSGDRFLIL